MVTTSIELVSFTGTAGNDGITLRWVTAQEQGTRGFHLYRSAVGVRGSAVRITPQLIPAIGGGTYTFLDTDTTLGQRYTYWLQEVETGGTLREYGPIMVTQAPPTAALYKVFMPFVRR